MRRLNYILVEKPAVTMNAGSAPAPIVATKIDGTGFSRSRFTFKLGGAATTGSLSTGLGVYQAATSGGTFTLITGASAAAVTSGVLSGGANNLVVIDVPIGSANPWLQLSGSMVSTGPAYSAIVELYGSITRPPTSAENQVIVV